MKERSRAQQLSDQVGNFNLLIKQKQEQLEGMNKQLQASQLTVLEIENLKARQVKLEEEKNSLIRDKETLIEVTLTLQSQIQVLQKEKQEQQEQGEKNNIKQLRQLLRQAQRDLEERVKEHQQKLKEMEEAKSNLEKAQKTLAERTKKFNNQLQIFQKYGLPPKVKVFQEFLTYCKRDFKRENLLSPKIFISYAWEDSRIPGGKEANENLQKWLNTLTKNLQKIGASVFFDLDNLSGNLRDSMRNNIEKSNFFILVTTPRWKQRILQGLTPTLKDCIENGRVDDLREGLRKLRENLPGKEEFDPQTNNATYEFIHIWSKIKSERISESLFIVQYSGAWDEAILPIMKGELIRSVVGIHSDFEIHARFLADTSNPVGIIPCVYRLQDDLQRKTLGQYERNLYFLKMEMDRINLISQNS